MQRCATCVTFTKLSIIISVIYGNHNRPQTPLASYRRAKTKSVHHRQRHPRHLRAARTPSTIDHPTIRRVRRASSDHHQGAAWRALARHRGQRSHWLHRVNEDILFANHLTVEDMHRLGEEAEALLRAKQIIPPEEWIANTRIGGKSASPSNIIRLAHDHMASNIALDIEIGARGRESPSKATLTSYATRRMRQRASEAAQNSRHVNGHHTFVEPDALFVIGNRNYALEADKGTESIKRVIVTKISPIARSSQPESSTTISASTISTCCSQRRARRA